MRSRWRNALLRVALPVSILALWETLVHFEFLNRILFLLRRACFKWLRK